MKLNHIYTESAIIAYNNCVEENWKKWLAAAALAGSVATTGCSKPDEQVKSKHPLGSYYEKQRETDKQYWADREAQLRRAKRKSGTFTQGKLVPDGQGTNNSKNIESQSTTSPDADDYL